MIYSYLLHIATLLIVSCLSIKAPTKPADAFQRHQCLDPQADDCRPQGYIPSSSTKSPPSQHKTISAAPPQAMPKFDSMPYFTSRAYESARSSFPFCPVLLPRRVSRGDCSVLSSSSSNYVPEGRSTVTCSPVTNNKSRSAGGSCLVLTDRNPFIHCNAKPNATTRLTIHSVVLSSLQYHINSVNIPLHGWISLASSGPISPELLLPSARLSSPRID